MVSVIGLVVLFVMVFGGFALTGGNLGVVMHALPHEMLIIGGAAAGATLISTDIKGIKAIGGGFGAIVRGPRYKRQEWHEYDVVDVARFAPPLGASRRPSRRRRQRGPRRTSLPRRGRGRRRSRRLPLRRTCPGLGRR